MFGIGFIPLIMAYEYIKHRDKYCKEYLIISIIYLLCLPLAYYDALFYKDFGEFNLIFNEGILPYIYRGFLFVSGTFLLFKGIQELYHGIIHLINKKTEEHE